MKLIHSISFSLLASIALVGCGGGGGSSSVTSGESSSFTLSGTVPGTLIEALCKDGSYYSTKSTNNGTSNHPFKLELPLNVDCKLIMTTNENDPVISNRIVTPIQFSSGGSTSTYLNLEGDVDLGYVGLAVSGAGGVKPLLDIAVTDNKLKIKTFSLDPLDDDKDGVPNIYEDDDGDGKYNKDDDDDDGDGIKDKDDKDHRDDDDGDGIKNDYDKDDDGDGIEDSKDNDHQSNGSTSTTPITLASNYTENPGRLLGSQCAQCHGTNGVSTTDWDSIAGENDLADEIHDDDPIMSAQAKGYTDAEINLIGSWLQTLPKNND